MGTKSSYPNKVQIFKHNISCFRSTLLALLKNWAHLVKRKTIRQKIVKLYPFCLSQLPLYCLFINSRISLFLFSHTHSRFLFRDGFIRQHRKPALELQDLNGGAGDASRRAKRCVRAPLHGFAHEAPLHQSRLFLQQRRRPRPH